jgi:hypothetical protein
MRGCAEFVPRTVGRNKLLFQKRGKIAEIFCLDAQSLDRGEKKRSRRKSEAGNYIA